MGDQYAANQVLVSHPDGTQISYSQDIVDDSNKVENSDEVKDSSHLNGVVETSCLHTIEDTDMPLSNGDNGNVIQEDGLAEEDDKMEE